MVSGSLVLSRPPKSSAVAIHSAANHTKNRMFVFVFVSINIYAICIPSGSIWFDLTHGQVRGGHGPRGVVVATTPHLGLHRSESTAPSNGTPL